jgi:hypothetical protein
MAPYRLMKFAEDGKENDSQKRSFLRIFDTVKASISVDMNLTSLSTTKNLLKDTGKGPGGMIAVGKESWRRLRTL